MSVIEVNNVSRSFNNGKQTTEVLKNISLTVEEGDFVSIMGPSGSGKSTLLYLLGGLDQPTEGTVSINGRDLSTLKDKELSRMRNEEIGFVFQFYNLVPNLNVVDNISLPLMLAGKKISDYKDKINECLELIGMQDKRKLTPRELSGGQQQRVAIARALVFDPDILFLDEPIGNLDSKSGTKIMELFRRIWRGTYPDVLEATPEFVASQIDCVFTDIRPDAVKIGMVSNAQIISVIAAKLKEYKMDRIVVDPVMVATSGSKLMKDDAVATLRRELLPLATVITPNIPEAEVLAGFEIKNTADMERAARVIAAGLNGAVLVKGGHLTDSADDLLWTEGRPVWFASPRVDNPNTHGTGCTLSSAIACELAKGKNVEESVRAAKAYINGALKAGLNLGAGSGPLDHAWATPEVEF